MTDKVRQVEDPLVKLKTENPARYARLLRNARSFDPPRRTGDTARWSQWVSEHKRKPINACYSITEDWANQHDGKYKCNICGYKGEWRTMIDHLLPMVTGDLFF